MILAQPVESVFDDEAADVKAAGVVVIDGIAPRGFVACREVGTELREVISLIAEVVVDDIEEDGKAALVGGIDEAAKRGGTAVVGLHGVEADAIVAPVAWAGYGVEGHEFDGGDAEVVEIFEAMDGGVESGLGGKGADVEFVEHKLDRGNSVPVVVLPGKCGIDDFGGAVDALGKQPRDRIGKCKRAGDVLVAITGGGGQSEGPVPVGEGEHGELLWRSALR